MKAQGSTLKQFMHGSTSSPCKTSLPCMTSSPCILSLSKDAEVAQKRAIRRIAPTKALLIACILLFLPVTASAAGADELPRYLNVTNLYSSLQEVSIWGLHWMFSLIAWMLFTQAVAFHLLRPYFLNLFSTFNFRIGSDIWLMNFVMTRDLMAALAFALSLLMTAPKVVYMMITGTTGFLYSSYNLWLFAGSQLLGLALLLKLFVETEEDVRGYYIFNGLIIISYTIFTIGIYKASYTVVSFLRG